MKYAISYKDQTDTHFTTVVAETSDVFEPAYLLHAFETQLHKTPDMLKSKDYLLMSEDTILDTNVVHTSRGDVILNSPSTLLFVQVDSISSCTLGLYVAAVPFETIGVQYSAAVAQDSLETLLDLQSSMNDVAFNKQTIHSVASGETMETSFFFRNLTDPAKKLTATSDTCTWLRNYIWAAKEELGELEELIPKKWWSKNELDLENAREEFIDVVHFVLSIGLSLGLDKEGIMEVYHKKNAVNLQRQAAGYHARGNG